MTNMAEALKKAKLLSPKILRDLEIKEGQKTLNAEKQHTNPKNFNKNGIPHLKEEDDELFKK